MIENLKGKKFGRLTVLERVGSNKHRISLWKCICDCGNETIVNATHLRNGKTKSCGCLQKDKVRENHLKHNQSYSKLYANWCNMRYRCNVPTNLNYYKYGARGISVCKEWDNTENGFHNFYEWSIANGYKETPNDKGRNSLSIDRIDNDGDYCPENCRWVNATTQQNNMRRNHLITYNGKTQSIAEWAREFNIPYNVFNTRINHNWSIERAITQPIRKK